jgi:hypothetical protein
MFGGVLSSGSFWGEERRGEKISNKFEIQKFEELRRTICDRLLHATARLE